MRHYIIASHKDLAKGFHAALQTIVGEVENVYVINAYVSNDNLSDLIEACMGKIPLEDDLIVLSDIYGGSVNTEFMKYLNKREFHLVAGINLALMIAIIIEMPKEVTREKILEIIEDSRQAIHYCNDDLEKVLVDDDF